MITVEVKLRDVLYQPDYGGDLYPYGFVVCEDPKCVQGGENYENDKETGRLVINHLCHQTIFELFQH